MKKLSIILTLFLIFCQKSYAANPGYFEALHAKSEPQYTKLCKRIKPKTDKERIDCLEAEVKYLTNAFLVYREYYENTITILDLRYGNDLKNTRQ